MIDFQDGIGGGGWIYVSPQTLHQNDEDQGDRPAITLQRTCGCCPPMGEHHRVKIYSPTGTLIAQVVQRRPGDREPKDRPHVWVELEPAAIIAAE